MKLCSLRDGNFGTVEYYILDVYIVNVNILWVFFYVEI